MCLGSGPNTPNSESTRDATPLREAASGQPGSCKSLHGIEKVGDASRFAHDARSHDKVRFQSKAYLHKLNGSPICGNLWISALICVFEFLRHR